MYWESFETLEKMSIMIYINIIHFWAFTVFTSHHAMASSPWLLKTTFWRTLIIRIWYVKKQDFLQGCVICWRLQSQLVPKSVLYPRSSWHRNPTSSWFTISDWWVNFILYMILNLWIYFYLCRKNLITLVQSSVLVLLF